MGRDVEEAPGGDPHPSLSPASYELIQYPNPWQARADNLNLTGKESKAEQGHPAGRLEARRKPWDGTTEEACSTTVSLVTPGRKAQRLESGNRLCKYILDNILVSMGQDTSQVFLAVHPDLKWVLSL